MAQHSIKVLIGRLATTLVVVCLAGTRGVAQQPGSETETAPPLRLEDAVAIALKANRQIQARALDIRKASEETAAAKTSRFPQFSVSLTEGRALTPIDFIIPRGALGVYPGVGPLPAQDSDINPPQRFSGLIQGSVTQPLSQLYKIGLSVRESQLGEDLARESLHQLQDETAYQVTQAYGQLAVTQAEISSAEVAVKYLTALAALSDRRLVEQAVLRSDTLTVKAKLSQQQYQLQVLRDAFDTQRETLNRLLGRDLQIAFAVEVQPLAPGEDVDLEAAQRRAIEQRPEVRSARLQKHKAELDVRRQRAEYIPDVSAQVYYLSFVNSSFLPSNIVQVGVAVQWQPFDWGQKHHRVQALESGVAQASLTDLDVEAQVMVDVRNTYRKLRAASAFLDVQRAVRDVERERLRVLMNRYVQQSTVLSDVLQQQSALSTADTQYRQAVANVWIAASDFHRALGGA